MLVLVAGLAPALGVAQPATVASGEDLAVWQALEHRRLAGLDRVAAYRAFVERFPSSPLAVVAWGRLHEVGMASVWSEDVELAARLADVQARWVAHRQMLSRPVEAPRVESLTFKDDGLVVR